MLFRGQNMNSSCNVKQPPFLSHIPMVACVIRHNRVFQQCVQSKPRRAAIFVRLVLFVELVKTLEMYYSYYKATQFNLYFSSVVFALSML